MYIINYNTSQQNDRTNPVRIEYQRVQQSRTYSTSQVGKCWETVLRSSEYGKSQLNNTNEHPLSSMHKHIFSISAEKKQRAERHGMSTTWTTWPQRASCTAEAKSLKSLTCHALDVGTSLKSLTCHLCFLWVQYWNQRWRWIQVIPGLGRRLYKPLETKARLAARHVACINVTVALKHVESCYYHRFIRSCKFHWWNSKTWEAWSAPKDRANDTIL